MKLYLTKGFLLSTGFDCYDSLRDSSVDRSGDIPFPSGSESVIGGHAVCIYGYDNDKKITNPYSNQATKGAFLIKNSWVRAGAMVDLVQFHMNIICRI